MDEPGADSTINIFVGPVCLTVTGLKPKDAPLDFKLQCTACGLMLNQATLTKDFFKNMTHDQAAVIASDLGTNHGQAVVEHLINCPADTIGHA